MEKEYLSDVQKQFEFYKRLGEKTFDQLSDDELLWQYNDESNSIAIIVSHLSGNMLSRWTDFLSSDGEKEWRNRETEFVQVNSSKHELIKQWNDGWTCLFDALAMISKENFFTSVYIRNQKHTVVEAINRQLMHYAYHVGQITYIGKMIKAKQWKSLSIPKGGSSKFNQKKFLKGKHKGHFTDDLNKTL